MPRKRSDSRLSGNRGRYALPSSACRNRQRKSHGLSRKDVDKKYRKGVEKVLEEIGDMPVALAVLKSRSPTCGVHEIYDGTFTGRKIKGSGILAEALQKKGIPVIDEEDPLFDKK